MLSEFGPGPESFVTLRIISAVVQRYNFNVEVHSSLERWRQTFRQALVRGKSRRHQASESRPEAERFRENKQEQEI